MFEGFARDEEIDNILKEIAQMKLYMFLINIKINIISKYIF